MKQRFLSSAILILVLLPVHLVLGIEVEIHKPIDGRTYDNSMVEFEVHIESELPARRLCLLELAGPSELTRRIDRDQFKAYAKVLEYESVLEGLREGDYTLTMRCDGDEMRAEQSVEFTIDDTRVPIFATTPLVRATTSDGATIQAQVNEPSSFAVIASTDLNEEDAQIVAEQEELSQQTTLKVSGLDPDTRYYSRVKVCDANAQCRTSQIFTFYTDEEDGVKDATLSEQTASTLSYTTDELDAIINHAWGDLTVGEMISLDVDADRFTMRRFEARIQENTSNVKLSLRAASDLPRGASEPAIDHIMEYWIISASNLEKARSFATLRAPKAWMRELGLEASAMRMLAYRDDAWVAVPMHLDHEELHFAHFTVPLEGFGLYVLGADDAPPPAEAPAPEQEPAAQEPSADAEQEVAATAEQTERTIGSPTGNVVITPTPEGVEEFRKEQHGRSSAIIIAMGVLVGIILAAGIGYYVTDQLKLRRGFDTSGQREAMRSEYEEHMDRLEGYITEAAMRGYPREVIREKLLGSGWREELVDRMLSRYLD